MITDNICIHRELRKISLHFGLKSILSRAMYTEIWVIFFFFFLQEKICEDSASFDMRPGDLATAMEEINRVSDKLIDLCESERLGDGEQSDSTPGKLSYLR